MATTSKVKTNARAVARFFSVCAVPKHGSGGRLGDEDTVKPAGKQGWCAVDAIRARGATPAGSLPSGPPACLQAGFGRVGKAQ